MASEEAQKFPEEVWAITVCSPLPPGHSSDTLTSSGPSWGRTSKGLGPWLQENAYFLYTLDSNAALRKSTMQLTKLTLSCHFFAGDLSLLLLIVRFFSLNLLFFGFLEMCLGVSFFLFILLEIYCSPLSMHLCLSSGLENSLQILFLLHYSLLSFWDSIRFLLKYTWHMTLYQFQAYKWFSIWIFCEVITTINLVSIHYYT